MARASLARRWLWIFLGAGAFLLHILAGKDSVFVENFYSRGIFVGIRWFWDNTLGRFPVPLIYVLAAGIVFWALRTLVLRLSGKAAKNPSSPWAAIGKGLLVLSSWAGALVFSFYVLWGFNYDRMGIERQLGLDAAPLEAAALRAEAERTAGELAAARALIPGATEAALPLSALPPGLEGDVRIFLSAVLLEAGYPAPGRVRVRPLWPGGWLMRFSSTGFYCPWACEGYRASNLMPSERPFVTAHEMAHGFGITDEGEANLLGFLACASSNVPVLRYSGLLAYWDYVFAEFARSARDDAARLAARLPEGVKADIRAEITNWDRYRGPLREASRAVYERYLKSQGVKEGLRSYDRFVVLVAAWRRLNGQPVPRPDAAKSGS
jgi:hypothetical protein